MKGFNQVLLIGNTVAKPDLKTTQSGKSVAHFVVATERRSNKTAPEGKKVDFHKVVVWNKLAELCNKYLDKGSKVIVIGDVRNSSYENKDGSMVFVTEISAKDVHFLPSFKTNPVKVLATADK